MPLATPRGVLEPLYNHEAGSRCEAALLKLTNFLLSMVLDSNDGFERKSY
jgi:hypothetical protein